MALKIYQTKEYKSLVWKLFWKAKAKELGIFLLIAFCITFLPVILFNIYWHNTPQTWIGHEYCKAYTNNGFTCIEHYYPTLSEIWLIMQWFSGVIMVVLIGLAIGLTWTWISENWDDAQAEAIVKIRAKWSNKRK